MISTIINYGAPAATLHYYRIIDEEGEYAIWDLIQALEDVKHSDMDIVNLSLGRHKPNCHGNCRECRVIEQVTESGTHVVAAAGEGESKIGTWCPSKSSHSIAVGGFQDLCRFSPHVAPQSLWVQRSDPDPDEDSHSENYCSHLGCNERMECGRNRRRQSWPKNIDLQQNPPNTLSPVHHVFENEDEADIEEGTSFSAGYVSGSLAAIFSLIQQGGIPEPSDLIRSIDSLPNHSAGGVPFFDVSELLDEFN